MSWYGSHPNQHVTKKKVRRLAPEYTCKECIYKLRLIITWRHTHATICCQKCKLNLSSIDIMKLIVKYGKFPGQLFDPESGKKL